MDTPGAIQLISLFFLIVLSGFFSSAETAFAACNRLRMKSMEEEGVKAAARVNKILEQNSKMLSAILVGNNVVNLSASAIATTMATRYFGLPVGVMTGILTLVVLIFGEIVPKTWASVSAEKLALAYSGIIRVWMTVMTPVIFLLDKLSRGILFLFRIDPDAKSQMTENELKTMVDVSHEDGVIETEEREMIYNVFEFSDAVAKDIMIPRVRMVSVDVDDDYKTVMDVFRECMYTRLPVYEGEKDHIIGHINMKDFILCENPENFHVRDILREALFTHEYKKTSDLMVEMRKETANIAFVINEYGTTEGMITLEDLLEEIVGEIRDEYDEDEKELIQAVDERTYLVEASLNLDDLNDAIGSALSSEEYDSVGGVLIEHLDHLPEDGEEVVLEDGTKLKVCGMDQNRIEQVEITLPEPKEAADEEAEDEKESEKEPGKEPAGQEAQPEDEGGEAQPEVETVGEHV
ncbi:MAG: HlyC/CorC family transporter [Lachnospiraceae bacterium]|nr:HlyC/CorC family transporter [Lachnospiraceae bacterium]